MTQQIKQFTESLGIHKKDIRRLGQRINHAQNTGETLNYYIGTCPDYSNDGINYTFESVGEGVPLLTHKQLNSCRDILQDMERLWRTCQSNFNAC